MQTKSGLVYNSYKKGIINTMPFFHTTEIFGCFDIETTTIDFENDKHAIMYIWQFCYGDFENRECIIGRDWQSFKDLLHEIVNRYSYNCDNPFRCYVHNLAFEFQFLRSIFDITDVFALKKRIPVSCVLDRDVKMLCSYKLTNMGLRKFIKSENIDVEKGELDYTIQRFPDDDLDDETIDYAIRDVIGMHKALAHLFTKNNDTIKSTPLTSTGYVRREARAAVQANPENRTRFLDSRLNETTYCLSKAMSRGGNAHCNFIYTGTILDDLKSKDRSSSYPAVMAGNYKYPFGQYIQERKESVIEGCSNIMHIALFDVHLKKGVYMPYMALGKCQSFSRKDMIIDNGRILQARYVEMVITEVDYTIIKNQYTWSKMQWLDHYVSEMDYLPKEYRELVYNWYKAKCELKYGDEYYYNKIKNKVNALFGMMLTDVARENIVYVRDDWHSEICKISDDLHKYYKNRKSFLSYQHGAYVTAYARMELQKAIDAVGRDSVYCDTDSLKYLNDHEKVFTELNDDIRKNNEIMGLKPVIIGNDSYELGIWEDDAQYKRFICFGSKKYAYEYYKPNKNGDSYGVTVAGLNKNLATEYINKYGLEEFKLGKVFDEDISGRLTPHYNDTIQWRNIEVDGHKCELTSNIALLPTTYTLGISKDYEELLSGQVWTD